jgi:hypothetical protein
MGSLSSFMFSCTSTSTRVQLQDEDKFSRRRRSSSSSMQEQEQEQETKRIKQNLLEEFAERGRHQVAGPSSRPTCVSCEAAL